MRSGPLPRGRRSIAQRKRPSGTEASSRAALRAALKANETRSRSALMITPQPTGVKRGSSTRQRNLGRLRAGPQIAPPGHEETYEVADQKAGEGARDAAGGRNRCAQEARN